MPLFRSPTTRAAARRLVPVPLRRLRRAVMRIGDRRGRSGGPLARERSVLRKQWVGDPEKLDSYLVVGYQNPRINAQSILLRHFFVRRLFGSRFDDLMREELDFSVRANAAIRRRAADAGVRVIPRSSPEKRAEIAEICSVNTEQEEEEFERRWGDALAGCEVEPLTVCEFACGSANDYRFFDSYGLARHLRYTGIDISEDNIANAGARCPGADFRRADILNLPFDDDSFDYVFGCDILEHLSIEAMQQAVAGAGRVARRGLVFVFFKMRNRPDHLVVPRRGYHANVLSRRRVQEELLRAGFDQTAAIHLPAYLSKHHGATWTYNKQAWILSAEHLTRPQAADNPA